MCVLLRAFEKSYRLQAFYKEIQGKRSAAEMKRRSTMTELNLRPVRLKLSFIADTKE